MDNRPIGVFDSGLGGLMAADTLRHRLPREEIIYFGDSGRMPYGGRTREELLVIARQNIAFLRQFDVKAVLIACGTISTTVLETVQAECGVPVFGVLQPAAAAALDATDGKVGVIATQAATDSGAYVRALTARDPEVHVTAVACPRFAPMVEAGHFGRTDPEVVEHVRDYLEPVVRAGADTLILGCTHYSLLVPAITDYLGRDVWLVDAGAAAADALIQRLAADGLLANRESAADETYYTSGDPAHFAAAAKLFLGRDIQAGMRHVPPAPIDIACKIGYNFPPAKT
jgi:glutamate racemase